jgi:hypothetical protein
MISQTRFVSIFQDQLEVTETGHGVKVQADVPHLVSLGGGRLSTAVTILPLKPGRWHLQVYLNMFIIIKYLVGFDLKIASFACFQRRW